jgi:hypothetical protein
MAQTFDIRFARSAGLAALLEAPGNRFRWKGGGLLRIDADSIRFSVKRGLLSLFARNQTQRIPAEDLREVYREGEALRVEFQTDDTSRVVLPFWAGNRDIAAQIVRSLPTSQTVEIEHSTDATDSGKSRLDWRMLMLLGVVIVALVSGTWAVYERTDLSITGTPTPLSVRATPDQAVAQISEGATPPAHYSAPPVPSPVSSARRVEAPAFPLNTSRSTLATRPNVLEPPAASTETESKAAPEVAPPQDVSAAGASPTVWRVRVTSDGVVPIVPGMPSYEAARRQIDLFLAESNTLRGYFLDARYLPGRQRFADIEKLWWKVTVRVSNSLDFEDPALRPLQEIELAVSRAWRRAFAFYADPALLVTADAEVEFAEMLEARARQFVD